MNAVLILRQLDDTVLYLIGAVAPPIVQSLVDQAELTFNQANITYVFATHNRESF